jgi:hypothetical protein
MRFRSVVVGAALATGLLVAGVGSASANVVWCLYDPPLQVSTSSGANLTVNTTIYVPHGQQQLAGKNVAETSSAAPDGSGGTLITVSVGIPVGVSTALVTASVNRFNVSGQASGPGGSTVTVYLDVPAA